MKFFTCLLFAVLLSSNLQAQNKRKGFVIEEPIFIDYYKPDINLMINMEKFKDLNYHNIKINTVKAAKLKVGKDKSYDRLNFEINGLKLYCAGKIFFKRFKYNYNFFQFKIHPSSDLFFQSNNQLFCSINDINEETIKKGATMYNEDGSYMYHETPNDDKLTTKIVSQKDKNEYNFIIHRSTTDIKKINSEKFGGFVPNYSYEDYYSSSSTLISSYNKDISTIQLANGDRYTGFSTIGTYHSQDQGSFTGYMFPMQKTAGNASVLFRELEGKYDWVLIVDNQIEMTLPAKADELPQFDELMNNLENTLGQIANPKVQFYADIVATYRTNFGVYRSKNISTLNGYGVNFTSTDSIRLGDAHFIEVGFFKNGKLDGLGYRCKMQTFYNKPITKNEYLDNNSSAISEKVDAEAGIFKEGKLIKGRDINIKNNNRPALNYWSKNKIEGSNWIIRENFNLDKQNIISSIEYKQIKANDKVHIYKLGFDYLVKRIDVDRKAIVVESDGKELYINKDSGPVYLTYVNQGYADVYCPATKYVKTYKDITVTKSVPSYSYETRKVSGALVDYVYTTRKATTSTYSYNKRVFNGSDLVPCTTCKGTGSKKIENNVRVFREVIF